MNTYSVIFSDLFISSGQLIPLKQCKMGPLNNLNSVMLILAHSANIQDVLGFLFFVARASVVFLIVPRGATPSLQNSMLFTFHQCQNTKSPSKLVSPQHNGSQTLFHRRFHCSALLLTFGGGRTSSFDVNGGHVRMQLTSAARCFVLSSAVILFDPHVKERRRLLATCDRRLWGLALLKKRKKNGSGSLLSLCNLEEQHAERLSVQAQTTRRPFDFWY